MAKPKIAGQVGPPSTDSMTSYRSSYQDSSRQNLDATPNLRALFGFHLESISLRKLRFLRVLHIEHSNLEDFSKAIGGCIHLRCLRLRWCKHATLPSSIGQLLYLQTIDLRGTVVPLVPSSLWEIPSLRHVDIGAHQFSPSRGVQQKELQTLILLVKPEFSGIKLLNGNVVWPLGQMTQLRTLLFLKTCLIRTPLQMRKLFANMPRLVEVELRRFREFDKLPDSHHFPQNLRRLILVGDDIKQDPMPVLEKLPCLVVLRLHRYTGRTMSCSARGFPCLQNIHLTTFFETEEWKIEAGAMPKLSHLILSHFNSMIKLPEGLLHLPSLNHLELKILPMISIADDSTGKELQHKGCEVTMEKIRRY